MPRDTWLSMARWSGWAIASSRAARSDTVHARMSATPRSVTTASTSLFNDVTGPSPIRGTIRLALGTPVGSATLCRRRCCMQHGRVDLASHPADDAIVGDLGDDLAEQVDLQCRIDRHERATPHIPRARRPPQASRRTPRHRRRRVTHRDQVRPMPCS